MTLCAGARDVTAAYCAKQILTAGRAWNPALAKHCRAAESSAAGAAIGRTWWDGRERAEPLHPKTDVQVTLNVRDQFDQLRPWDNATEVRASIDLARAHGATLDGFKHNKSVNGVVQFNFLRFSQPGAFDLRFSIGDKYVAMVRVVVEPTGDEGLGPTGRCGQVYYPHLTSFNRGTNESVGQPAVSAGDEQVALLRWPQSMEALACVPVMEDAGFKISQGWGGDLWVWYFRDNDYSIISVLIEIIQDSTTFMDFSRTAALQRDLRKIEHPHRATRHSSQVRPGPRYAPLYYRHL